MYSCPFASFIILECNRYTGKVQVKITHLIFRDTLMEIFYRCDLNGNGYLSREEFDIFQKRTSGEECDDAAWQVVQGNIIL